MNNARRMSDAFLFQDSFIFPTSQALNVDAETNTECVFIQQPVIGRKQSREDNLVKVGQNPSSSCSVVKRSKTFSPSAPINKSQYNCRVRKIGKERRSLKNQSIFLQLNRSDSDSAMPLYRRMPFQRSSKERRSLHVPTSAQLRHKSQNKNPGSDVTTKTSIDLELDLAAQQSKLMVLSEEIERLRQIKTKMEEAKAKGDKELPLWLQEDEKFQILLASVSIRPSLKTSKTDIW